MSEYVYVADLPDDAKPAPIPVDRIAVSPDNWLLLERCIATQLHAMVATASIDLVAILACSTGLHGATVEAIKAEVIVELESSKAGCRILRVAPQSLPRALGCASKEKWMTRAEKLFNSHKQVKYFGVGMGAAMAVAYYAAKAESHA